MKIDWKLKGSNLLRFGCGKDVTVHPETCSDVVLMGHNGSQSLTDWITKDTETGLGTSLTDWITNSFIKTVGEDVTFEIKASYTPDSDSWDYTNSLLLGTLNNNEEDEIRVPYGSTSSYGAFKVGEGLQATNGVLALKAATTSTYGGIKLFDTNETLPEGGVPVQLSNGKAYVDFSGSIDIESIIYRWDEYNPTHTATTPAINPSAYIVSENADNFSSINIYDYIDTIKDLFNTSVNRFRIYPVRTDAAGHLYTFVPWTDTTYRAYNNTSSVGNGLVPYTMDFGNDDTAFLRKDGTWQVPSYTNLKNKPTVYTGSTSGFVPQAPSTGITTKYLRADGSWEVPPDTNTTYSGDNTTVFLRHGEFSDPHQYTRIANSDSEIYTFLASNPFEKFNKVNYIVPGLSDSNKIAKAIQTIFDKIGQLKDGTFCRFVYSFEDANTITALIDNDSAPSFINYYKGGKVSLSAYGSDMTVNDDDSTIANVSKIQVVINTAGTAETHYDLIFDVKVIEAQIYLALICEKQDVITNNHSI